MRPSKGSITQSLATLGIVMATALGADTAPNEYAYGMVGSQFVVYGTIFEGGSLNGFLVFSIPQSGSIDKHASPLWSKPAWQEFIDNSTLQPWSTPLPSNLRRAGVALGNGQLVFLGNDSTLYSLDLKNGQRPTWSQISKVTPSLPESGAQLIHINDSAFFAVASDRSIRLIARTSFPDGPFVNTPIPSSTTLISPQYGYSPRDSLVVAVGQNQLGRLDAQFFTDPNNQLRQVPTEISNSGPAARTGFCFTWDEASSAFYLFGGETPTSRFNDAYSLQGDDRGVWRWTVLDTPPNITRRVNAACAVHNNQLILWGGTGNISDIEADAIVLSSLNGGPGGGGVNVDPEPNNDSPSSSPPLGAIIGGTVGGLALLLLLGFGMVMFCRRKKRNAGHHRRGKAVSGDHDVYETKSRSMPSGGVVDGSSHGDGDGGGAVVPLVPSPFEIDQDDGSMGPYSRSINARSPTESSSFTAASTLHYPPHHQPLMDHAMVPAISSPEYLSHSASPSPPLPPIMTSQPFGYHQHQYPYATSSSSSSPLQGSPSHRLSLSAPLPLPTEVEIQSRAIPSSGNNNGNGVVTPHQRFEPHGVPYTMTNAPPPLPPPSSRPMYGSGGPPFTQASMSAPTSAPFPGSTSVHNPMSPPSPPPPPPSSSQEPEWDVLIPVTDEDDMSTQAALGMTSSVRGLSASHREFKHELPDSDVEEDDNDEGDATAGMSTAVSATGKKLGGGGPKHGKPGSTAAETFGRRSSVSSLASHPESESGIGFLELWVPPADEPPVPPVPQSHR